MIKLLDIIEEGALILTPEERQQVETMIPDIISNIKKPLLPNDKVYDIGNIKYKFADGEDGEVKIVVGYPGSDSAKGVFRTHDPKNRTDNWIVINQIYFSQFFPSSNSFSDFDQRLSRTVTGNENTGIERLRQTLKHELIHAKDPALNHHYLKEPYSSKDEAIYYKSWTEFQTFTGQFFESLISGTDRVLNNIDNPEDIKRIEKALSNILQYFAGKTKTINLDTKEFIDGTGSRNFFQKIFNFLNQIVRMPKDSDYALSEYLIYLAKIKQYNPEGYKEFLKDLYKTIKSIEEKVNSVSNMKIKVQEMKSNINEVKRMQFLAGIINESEQHNSEMLFEEAKDDDIEKAIAKVLKIDPSKIDLYKIEKNEEPSKEDLKEGVVTLAITIAGLIPPALELVGSTTNWVKRNATNWTPEEKQRLDTINQNIKEKKKEANALDKANDPREKQVKAELEELIKTRDTIFGSKAGNFMKKWGEKLHHAYVWPIKKMLDGIAWYQRYRAKFYNDDKPLSKFATDEHLREKIANIMYATIMMSIAGVGAISHLKHLAGVATVATTIADGVKASKSAADILKDVLSFV
jgi:hypothetical protein